MSESKNKNADWQLNVLEVQGVDRDFSFISVIRLVTSTQTCV